MKFGLGFLQIYNFFILISKSFILKYLPWGFLFIAINSHGQTLSLGTTFFWWTIQSFVLILFLSIKLYYTSEFHNKDLFYLNIYLIYVLISVIRGFFIADGYWDWKNLVGSSMSLLIPMLAFASNSKILLKRIISSYIFFTAPLFLIIQFYIGKDEFGFYLAPISFLLLFFPIFKNKWKIIFIVIAFYVILADFGARSNVIKFLVPLLLSFIYYFRFFYRIKILNYLRLFFIISPFLFFSLAVTDTFNIFNPFKNIEIIDTKRDFKGNLVEDNLVADTRTFLYYEVLSSSIKLNSWLFGRSPARGNISDSFGESDLNKRNERFSNEVSILNYFTWLGLIGVILIFIIFYRASYLAVNYSNNIYIKIVGIFIAFRWSYGWVEDINNFYIQYLYLWLFIGFCFSRNFRQMSNIEMQNWVHDIFNLKNI
jgi:hypothetical protein